MKPFSSYLVAHHRHKSKSPHRATHVLIVLHPPAIPLFAKVANCDLLELWIRRKSSFAKNSRRQRHPTDLLFRGLVVIHTRYTGNNLRMSAYTRKTYVNTAVKEVWRRLSPSSTPAAVKPLELQFGEVEWDNGAFLTFVCCARGVVAKEKEASIYLCFVDVKFRKRNFLLIAP